MIEILRFAQDDSGCGVGAKKKLAGEEMSRNSIGRAHPFRKMRGKDGAPSSTCKEHLNNETPD